MNTIVKNIKLYSYELNKDDLSELKFISNQYSKVKNYVFSRYSGINSILLLNTPRKIRDDWTKSNFAVQWKLPARYWKLALGEAISNIKSMWSNIRNKIRDRIQISTNINDDEKRYLKYIIKSDIIYKKVLTQEGFIVPKNFQNKEIDFRKLHIWLRRYTRKVKGKIPQCKNKTTFSADEGLYRVKDRLLEITCKKFRQRVKVRLNTKVRLSKTLIIKIIDNRLEINCPLRIKVKRHANYKNIIGIDKGYRNLFATSTGNIYGEKLNNYLEKETERLKRVNQNRNRLYALYYKHLKKGRIIKANNILNNNLGKIKYNNIKRKGDSSVKSYINNSLNCLISNERPKEIVMEKLDFISWNDKYPKEVKRKISRWIKGYIKSRLEYKCDFNSIKYTYINPAYTSRICNNCGIFGKRMVDIFICEKCGEFHADVNASKNILDRKYDDEISIYTSCNRVKEVLIKRHNQ